MKFQVAIAASLVFAQAQTYLDASNQTIAKFCRKRPVGLYCNPETYFQKIECPSGEIYTCPKSPQEFCQERGILKSSGFKGGVARCVPFVSDQSLTSFCASRREGVYCFGDALNNIRVQCPSKLIYKCDDNPTNGSLVCNQSSPLFAKCVKPSCSTTTTAIATTTTGGGSGSGNTPTPFCPTRFVTVTSTRTARPVTLPRATRTVTKHTCAVVTTSLVYSTSVDQLTTTSTISGVTSVTETGSVTSTFISVVPTTSVEASTTETLLTSTFFNTEVDSTTFLMTSTLPAVTISTIVTATQTGGGGAVGGGRVTTVVTITLPTSTSICQDKSTTTVSSTGGAVQVSTPSIVTLPTSTSSPCTTATEGGAVGTGRPQVTTVLTTTSASGGGSGAGAGSPTASTTGPSATAVCTNGQSQNQIVTPAGLDFTYSLTSASMTGQQAVEACKALGGSLAKITSSNDHWQLGQQICSPVWYNSWETNDYAQACIALYPGGATSVPTQQCQQSLQALCSIPK